MKTHWKSDSKTPDRSKRPASLPTVLSGRDATRPWQHGRHRGRPLHPLGLVLLLAPLLVAQTPEKPSPPTGATSASVVADSPRAGLYHGPVSCASSTCHGATEPRRVFDVLQNEYLTWLQRDRHSKAHEVLVGPDSRRIAANLGLDQPAENAPLCLDCHAFEPPEEQVVGHVEREQGISCEACHGPASGWLGPHTEEGWTTEDGVAAGLIDLSDPIRRGELCLSCHRGEGDRLVDHRLIAAGHPQLIFELDNFSGDMPSHWRADPQADGARGWALGQVVALREELEVIAATADAGRWPELSLMACDDCHHGLEEERWRRRGARRPLGLPAWSPAKWAVTRHLVRRFAPGREAPLDRALDRLAGNISRLGSAPSEAAAAAREARAALEEVVPAVRDTQWNERQIKALLVSLAEDRQALAGADRDTALQAFLAVNTLASELIHLHNVERRIRLVAAVETLHRTIDRPYRYRSDAFAAGLDRVGQEVRRLR